MIQHTKSINYECALLITQIRKSCRDQGQTKVKSKEAWSHSPYHFKLSPT